jgi:uncharacterized membrane protein (DUF373 family)
MIKIVIILAMHAAYIYHTCAFIILLLILIFKMYWCNSSKVESEVKMSLDAVIPFRVIKTQSQRG